MTSGRVISRGAANLDERHGRFPRRVGHGIILFKYTNFVLYEFSIAPNACDGQTVAKPFPFERYGRERGEQAAKDGEKLRQVEYSG